MCYARGFLYTSPKNSSDPHRVEHDGALGITEAIGYLVSLAANTRVCEMKIIG